MKIEKQRRCFTIMIIPHSEESTFSLRLPFYAVQAAVFFSVIILAGFITLSYSYLEVSTEAKQVEELRQINRAQHEEIDALAVETQRAMNQLQEMDDLIESISKQVDSAEILEDQEILDVDNIQTKAQETRNKLLSSVPYNSHYEELTYHSMNSVVPYNYNASPEQPGLNFTGFNNLPQGSSTSGMVLDRAVDNITTLHNIIPEQIETLDEVETSIFVIEAKLEQLESKPSLWPARGRVTSGFGTRKIPYSSGYQFHTGVDIAGSHGSNVRAAARGEVVFSGYRGSLGNLLIIDHGYGYETYYAHLKGFTVRKGDEVAKGETIGYMGASGRTTGTHLHYEVHYKGSPVNPIRYMEGH